MEKFREFSLAQTGGYKTINHRVGLCTYGEVLTASGWYRGIGFNGIGYNVTPGMMTNDNVISDLEERGSFILELDGQSLLSGWEYVDHEKTEENGVMNVRLSLKHNKRPVSIVICTKFDGSGCFSRWLEITNTGDKSATLSRLAPLSGSLERTYNWEKLLQGSGDTPYRLGYFENTEHMHEGQFKWHRLHSDCYSFGGRYTRHRYRHPFCILENKAKGTCYAIQLAYSGGFKFSFDLRLTPAQADLCYVCEVDGANPLRVIAPGETVISPEVIISMVNGDMDMAIQQMHTHIRTCVMMPPHGPGCYTETATGGNIVSSKAGVDRAVANGFDIVYIDAGWYFPEGQDALGWTGIWDPDPKRFPNGMKELADYCHEKGIKFGLWMEPERLGSYCPYAERDRDKLLVDYEGIIPGGYPKSEIGGGLYDLSRKEVADFIEAQIVKMIEETGIDMFRLDFNVNYIAPWCCNDVDGFIESADFRYNEHFTAMFDRIRKRFPNVIFENCASGGGRTDLGCVKYFDHTWVTDNPVAPRCFAITNGMTMCLPPELVDRLVTTMEAPRMADLDFQLFQLMFVRPTSHFPGCSPENPLQIDKFHEFMKLYNEFAKPMLPTCKIYHHTPSFDDPEPKGVGILEAASEDASKLMLGVFALCDPLESSKTVRFKGADASKNYKITAVSAKQSFVLPGHVLAYKGLTVNIKAALTAELFLAEEI